MQIKIILLLVLGAFPAFSWADESYRVVSGDTLGGISAKVGVSYLDIMAANQMETASVYPGQVLIIPSKRIPSPPVPVPSDVSPFRDNTPFVASPTSSPPGPSASKYPGTVPSRPAAPTQPSPAAPKPRSVELPASSNVMSPPHFRGSLYVVQRGDTVRSISIKFGVAFWDLRMENDILFSTIRPGQILKIPARPATVGIAF